MVSDNRAKRPAEAKTSDFLETAMIYTLIILGCGVLGALLKVWLQGKSFRKKKSHPVTGDSN